ncbi:MAG: type II toxin-antitoxin system RelE/ParE family toxin [Pseudomonadota bacterium]
MKDIYWEGSSLRDVSQFTKPVKRLIGYELMRLQSALEPMDWKPMRSVGKGVREIRIHHDNEYRVLYVTHIQDSIHVLHVFVKKTQKTAKRDLDLAKQRYQALLKKRGK